jgi:hypothetical protein
MMMDLFSSNRALGIEKIDDAGGRLSCSQTINLKQIKQEQLSTL